MSKVIFNCFALSIFLLLVTFISSAGSTCSGNNKHTAQAAAYSGTTDCKGNKANTLQDYLAGKATTVTVAMDINLKIKYGTPVCIPELNAKYNKQIDFIVADVIVPSPGKGYSRIDINVDPQNVADSSVNGQLTLYFNDVQTGNDFCN